ncbi:hypothetical protein AKJ09_07158 [Labilithrix luteola]|uniref:Tetratricopeptide repeat protein n=1 Tax=Labilithrix luteola TaxID=1391654 RepID=A0A0K1Q509_9BACT|nr:hypothetical protein [Labilithrix luteola]AKV00495.1 hypothetical protein AKJ09_07158 [Labilithrix luteola]
MNGRDPMLEELFAPLSGEYGPTDNDRRDMDARIRARLYAPALASAAGESKAWAGLLSRPWAWIGFGALLLTGAVATMTASPSSKVESAPQVPVVAPNVAAAPSAEPSPSVPVVSIDALPTAAPVKRTVTVKSAAPAEDALARETRLLGRSNLAANAGELGEALRLLDEHAREFPQGVLADERAVERVVLLCRMGRKTEASREADAFLATHRGSPLRARVASTCAASSGTASTEGTP